MRIISLLTTLLICFPNQVFAACDQAIYRAFDFWLGTWQVTNQQNKNKAQNKISLINNGCTVFEQYQTPTGYQGKSFSMYNQQTQQWHQTWVDNAGLVLQLDGGMIAQDMVMTGKTYDQKGKLILNKIIWHPKANGEVTQQWLISKDQGASWQVVFNGLYQKQLTKKP